HSIGAVVLGEFSGVEEGQQVTRTGKVLSVPVGEGYLGRVVDTLGNPVDGLGEITGLEGERELELQAAGVMDRKSVHEPLQTGSEEHTSELQSRENLVCRLLLEKKK